MVATACLFFACKIEEQPRRLREVIDSIQKLFHKSNEPISQNSEVRNFLCVFFINIDIPPKGLSKLRKP
jgi:hypothetical protein